MAVGLSHLTLLVRGHVPLLPPVSNSLSERVSHMRGRLENGTTETRDLLELNIQQLNSLKLNASPQPTAPSSPAKVSLQDSKDTVIAEHVLSGAIAVWNPDYDELEELAFQQILAAFNIIESPQALLTLFQDWYFFIKDDLPEVKAQPALAHRYTSQFLELISHKEGKESYVKACHYLAQIFEERSVLMKPRDPEMSLVSIESALYYADCGLQSCDDPATSSSLRGLISKYQAILENGQLKAHSNQSGSSPTV